MSPSKRLYLISGAGAFFALLAFLLVQLTIANGLWMMFRANMGFWVLFLAFIVSAAFAFFAWDNNSSGYRSGYSSYGRSRNEPVPSRGLPTWVFVLFASGALLASIFLLFYSPYAKAVEVNKSNEIVKASGSEADYDTYKNRAPFTIAEQQTIDNTTINGSPQDTTYIPEFDKFGAPVVKKGIFQGYGQVVWQSIGETGQAKLDSCSFSKDASRRLGGSFTHNLERKIIGEDFGIRIDSGDSYAYCNEDGEPIVVVPFTKYEGFLFPIEVPAGVATYNGKSGELKIHKDVKVGEIPGPVYPISLAQQARDATPAGEGFLSWVQKKTGFSEYGGENSSDYTLRKADDSGDSFVTPLRMKGKGKAITAVGEVASNEFTAGKLNTYRLALLPEPRQGNSAVNDRVKSDYGDLNWASGLEIFEIVPTGPSKWAATIGLRKSIVYRLEINADGSSCLFSTRGEKLRCTDDDTSTPLDPDAPVQPGAPSDLGVLTNEQLVELQRQVTDEIAKRFTPAPAE